MAQLQHLQLFIVKHAGSFFSPLQKIKHILIKFNNYFQPTGLLWEE